MKHLAVETVAWATWVAVAALVIAMDVAEAALRYTPGRRLAQRAYTLGARPAQGDRYRGDDRE